MDNEEIIIYLTYCEINSFTHGIIQQNVDISFLSDFNQVWRGLVYHAL